MKNLILCLALLLVSCTSIRNGQVKKRYTQFRTSAPSGWLQKSFKGADLFYQHQSRQATIFLNAECDKLSDTMLEVLTSQLLVGLSNINYIKQEHKNKHRRPGSSGI